MPISKLKLTNLGPFDAVEFEFDPQVNVLVGPNNCGKSTALIAMVEITDPVFELPRGLLRHEGSCFVLAGRGKSGPSRAVRGTLPFVLADASGSLVPVSLPGQFRGWLGHVAFVPALRWSTGYRSDGPVSRPRHYAPNYTHWDEGRTTFSITSGGPEELHNASIVRDDRVLQDIIELDYRAYRQDKPALRGVVDQVASIASQITEGFPIGFAGVAEDERGLYLQFETPDGKVPLDVLSQGTQSLIQWLARLLTGYAKHYDFPGSLDDKPGILIIDEIDAHLHPSWQRRIIPAITKEFPSLQIFCSTHSPLMLAGLKAGQIHLLKRDKKGKVTVSRNETDIIGWSADEIVTTFLGVESATDFQTEQDIKRLQELRDKKRLSAKEREELERLRGTVNRALLSGAWIDDVEGLAARLATPQGKKTPKKAAKKKPTSRKKTSSRPSKRTIPSSKKRTRK